MFPSFCKRSNGHLIWDHEGTQKKKWISSNGTPYQNTTMLPIYTKLCAFVGKKQRYELKSVFDGCQAFFGGGVGDFGDEVHGAVAKLLFDL